MFSKWLKIFIHLFAITVFFISPAMAETETPVHFTADRLDYDDVEQVVTAHGNVELIQDGRILHADQMTYNLQKDIVTAIGNVSLLDQDGQVHFAEYLQLSDRMKSGFVNALTSYLVDGSRFMAARAERVSETLTVMEEASFTPCKVCAGSREEPTWQIKADKVVYDEKKGSVRYRNARLELFGIPLAYTPIFSHPDPQIEQKSGFLRPAAGWNSEVGTFVRGSYYWGIDKTKDATLHVQPTARQGVLVEGEYRQRFANGYINLTPSVAFNSDRTEIDNRVEEGLTRGHIEGEGRFDFNENWRGGFEAMRSSDDEYLRLYDISDENVLQNMIYAERFDGRDYTNINAQHYQDVRLGLREPQPDVLPSITHSALGAPEALLGGRWALDLGTLNLRRSDDGQDVNRLSGEAGWHYDYITGLGLSFITDASARLDYYHAQDLKAAQTDPNAPESLSEARFFPQIHSRISYPLVKNTATRQYLIEPRLAFTSGSQANEDDIPNEDSHDIQLDALNLFEPNRFPGEDLQDTGTRATYGLGGGVYYHSGAQVTGFFGQSYRFDDDNIFPDGSGLVDNYSDYVGSLRLNLFEPDIFLDYRTQLAHDDFAPRRHEIQGAADFGKLSMSTRYTYVQSVENTGFSETREQLSYGARYELTKNWSVQGDALVDFGEESGLRRASAGLIYSDECFNFALQGARAITNRSTGQSETTLLMRIGFKYLGELTAPQILLQDEAGDE